MAMQAQMRVMLSKFNRLVHEKTTATAAAARRSAAGASTSVERAGLFHRNQLNSCVFVHLALECQSFDGFLGMAKRQQALA
jgi:hypothetical protein